MSRDNTTDPAESFDENPFKDAPAPSGTSDSSTETKTESTSTSSTDPAQSDGGTESGLSPGDSVDTSPTVPAASPPTSFARDNPRVFAGFSAASFAAGVALQTLNFLHGYHHPGAIPTGLTILLLVGPFVLLLGLELVFALLSRSMQRAQKSGGSRHDSGQH